MRIKAEQFKVTMRMIQAYGYYGIQKALKLLKGDTEKVIRHLIFYPEIKDIAALADVVNRVSWYLPQSVFSQPEISILVDRDLLKTDLKDLVPPASQHNYVGQCENVRLVATRSAALSRADAILLWNKRSMFDPHVLGYLDKVNVVDTTYYFTIESITYERLYAQTLETQKKERLSELSKKNYRDLLDRVAGCDKGYVFGTGFSLDCAFEFDYTGGFRVVSNSIVKNKAVLKYIKPHLLMFFDPVFFFSPCRYAAEFRRLMLETVQEFECYIMVRDYQMPLLLAHYPHLENKIIGMPVASIWDLSPREIIRTVLTRRTKVPLPVTIPGREEEYNFPTVDRFYVRNLGNIMLSFMIPTVSSVCREIYFIGADGRPMPEKTYFSLYSNSSQFTDLMQTVFDTHPSVFRDGNVTQIYNDHCTFFEELVHYGESLGKRYCSLTPSYIPALASRLASPKPEK